jgi:hypothetical protein
MPGPGAITATRTVGLPARSGRYPEGRRCSHPGCETWLSTYNRATTCWLHSPRTAPRLRGYKRRADPVVTGYLSP